MPPKRRLNTEGDGDYIPKKKACKPSKTGRKVGRPRKEKPVDTEPAAPKRKYTKKSDKIKEPVIIKNDAKIEANNDSENSDEDCLVIDESEERYDVDNENENIYKFSDLDANKEFPIWNICDVLAEVANIELNISRNIVELINEENTLPFIARYRKSMINFMSPEKLQDIFDKYESVCKMKTKCIFILNTLKRNGTLTDEIQNSVIAARNMDELDLIYKPFKGHTKTLAERAFNLGLRGPVESILKGHYVNISLLCSNDMETPDIVKEHLIHGLADVIHKDFSVLEFFRKSKNNMNVVIECAKSRTKNKTGKDGTSENSGNNFKIKHTGNKEKYDLYVGFRMKCDLVKPHQILAINRGEAEKALSVKIVIPVQFYQQYLRFCCEKWTHELMRDAAADAYKRLFHPWLVRKIRSDMTNKAVKVSVDLFCSNLKRLLLTTPIKGKTIIGIDPGFAAGCKTAIIGPTGQPLETFVIKPNFRLTPEDEDPEASKLVKFMEKYKCDVIALGDGTACRETESWLRDIDAIKELPLIIVPEQGASIYSCSSEASKEFPRLDPNLISAISLARRALDPLSELIKVNPKHIGVGMYQHDIPSKLLNEALNNVTVNCVSFVGVDLNTSSENLLVKVAGLTENKVKHIIEYRESHGKFRTRDELLNVNSIGPKTFKQCAGFLRVPNSKNKLDNTWIHPESYKVAVGFLEEMNLSINEIGSKDFIATVKRQVSIVGIPKLARILGSNESDIELIVEALTQSLHEDPLRKIKPIYSTVVVNRSQLTEGAILTGVVRNVTSFGIFVDCGIGNNGLIHNSKIGNTRQPKLGETVEVMVIPPLTPSRIPLKLLHIVE